MTRRLDEADLVWAWAVATGREPSEGMATADVAGLVGVVAAAERARSPSERAARVLAGTVCRRPFRDANAVAGWLLAASTLAEDGLKLRIADDEALALVAGLRDGTLDVGDVVAVFERRSGAEAGGGKAWACPTCGRSLASPWPMMWALPAELTAFCSSVHGAHDRKGRPVVRQDEVAPPSPSWLPVVRSASGDLLVVCDGGAVFIRRADESGSRLVTFLRDVPVSALVGDWDQLAHSGECLGSAAERAVRLDEAERMVDWPHFLAASGIDRLPVVVPSYA